MSIVNTLKSMFGTKKWWINALFIALFGVVEILIIAMMGWVIFNFRTEVPKLVAMEIILLWLGVLIGYLAWAIYFFNINLGLTDQDWKDIRDRKADGEDVNEPTTNPNSEETLGLPKGTIRGVVALTMLVGGLALTIYSFGIDPTTAGSSFVVDHLEFFKTAFLMMIAFYFGNKSLEILEKNRGGSKTPPQATPTPGSPKPSIPKPATNPGIKNALGDGKPIVSHETVGDSDFDNPKAQG